MPFGSNRNESEANARLLAELLNPPTLPSVTQAPTRRERAPRRARPTPRAAEVVSNVRELPRAQSSIANVLQNMPAIGDVGGLETKEVRAIEVCARKSELLALREAINSELELLDTEINRIKRSA